MSMSFDEFVARFGRIPTYERARIGASWAERGAVTARVVAQCDHEIAEMDAARPRITEWSEVPDGARLFIRWGGGNRGACWRRGDWLYADERCRDIDRVCDPIVTFSPLGEHSMATRVWLDDSARAVP
jgi:hypothetical protein